MQLVMLDQPRPSVAHPSIQTPAPSTTRRMTSESTSLALAGVIGCIGRADFGSAALAHLDAALGVCWWSVYRLYADRPPHLHTSGSCGADDHTDVAFASYRRGLYEHDPTFKEAEARTPPGGAALTHWHSREIPARHRREIYQRHGLQERVSLVRPQDDGGVLAVNFYRGEGQAGFDTPDIELMRTWGAPLLAAVQVHIDLQAAMASRSSTPVSTTKAPAGETSAVPGAGCLAGLPRREREVCERLLRGWTYDGIGADLGISPGTVKTYRDRAFERLGLHHRNELFALALSDVSA